MINLKRVSIILAFIAIFTLLIYTETLATTGTISAETVNLRSEATTNSKILDQLDQGEKVEIVGEEGDWYKVKYESIDGYISKSLLDLEENEQEENNAEENNQNEEQENNAEENNQNEEQENNNVEENNQSEEQENNNVENSQSEEQESTNIENIETQENTVQKAEIQLNQKYNINSNIELRIIPLMNAIESNEIQANTTIEIKDIMNTWYFIATENNSGWVRKTVLEQSINIENAIINNEQTTENTEEATNTENTENTEETENIPEAPSTPNTSEVTEYDTPKTGYISATTVNFREEANTSSTVLNKLTKNTEITILGETNNGWYKATVGNQTGYVSATYVSDTKVPDTTSRGMSSTEITTQPEEPATSQLETNTTTTDEANTEQPESTENTTNSNIGNEIVAYANTFLGTKYVYGGSSPNSGFDCSGFTKYVYGHFGITLSRSSSGQASNGTEISKSELIPGDLLIFNGTSNTSVGHVGIYIGNNQFIHASNPSDGVKVTSLSDSYYVKRYVGARRVF